MGDRGRGAKKHEQGNQNVEMLNLASTGKWNKKGRKIGHKLKQQSIIRLQTKKCKTVKTLNLNSNRNICRMKHRI